MGEVEPNEDRLAADSDELLSEVHGLRAQEERKRRTTISSDEFHELADDVERRARRIWQAAADERQTGNETQPSVPTSTEEVDRSRHATEDISRHRSDD